jgi:hypothetical protein
METEIPIFLAVSWHFLPTARQEFLRGFCERGNLTEIPLVAHHTPEVIAHKAYNRGARAIIGEAGSKSPFGQKLTAAAVDFGLVVAFVPPLAPTNLRDFAQQFRHAQRDLAEALKSTPEKEAA